MAGCRGQKTEKRPFHPNPNMDDVARYNPQAPSDMFANGKAGRPRIEGTVSRDDKFELDPVRQGKDANGEYLTYIPMQVTREFVATGKKNFDIYCSVCHGFDGAGEGMAIKRGYRVLPPNFHQDSVRNFADGYIYNVITNGVRNMYSYRHQISYEDRWAVVAYVRALQESQKEHKLDELPQRIQATIK